MGFSLMPQKSLADMEEEEEHLKQQRRLLEEKVAIKQLKDRLGQGGWKLFSSNGKKSGFSLQSALAWLRNQGGGSKK